MAQESPRPGKKRRMPPLLQELLLLILKIGLIILAFVLLFTFVFGITRYSEPGMDMAVKDGDLVVYYRFSKESYVSQDVILLQFEGKTQARRVIATAGDTVDITEDGLLVNGAIQQEPDIHWPTERFVEGVAFPLTVPDGCVFVLGDARSNSTDSRIYGCVDVDDTLGKIMAILRRRSI